MRIGVIMVLVFCGILSYGQSSTYFESGDSTKWTSSKMTDIASNSSFDTQSVFLVYGHNNLVWSQQSGKKEYAFDIKRVEVNKAEVIYFVTSTDGRDGTVVFEKSDEGYTIRINFIDSDKDVIPFTFLVSEFRKL